jgi:hypothetical protein
MKTYFKCFFSAWLLLLSIALVAQDKSQRPSPPAQTKVTLKGGIDVLIDYSQPALKGRDFGSADFHPFGSIWRNGANEATWIEVSKDVRINGEVLPKGKYTFFVIPDEDEWILIFNSALNLWGAYDYDSSKDVMRVKASATPSEDYHERYTIKLDEDGNGSLNWGEITVSMVITAS